MQGELPREREDLLELCRQQGWQVAKTNNGHWRVRNLDGATYFTSSTPGDHRGGLNFRAALKRLGLKCSHELHLPKLQVVAPPTPAAPIAIIAAAATPDQLPIQEAVQMSTPRGTVQDAVRKAFEQGDSSRKGIKCRDLHSYVKFYRSQMTQQQLSVHLADGVRRGHYTRVGHGIYVLPLPGTETNATSASVPVPIVSATNGATPMRKLTMTSRTGDSAIDADLKALDNVLDVFEAFTLNQKRQIDLLTNALASLDSVIRTQLNKEQKFMELKRALNNL